MRHVFPDRAQKAFILPTDEHALPDGEWVVRRGVRVRVPDLPPVQYATRCHCGDYYQETCETCLAWAERDAERHQWARESKANRHIVWQIFERKAA